MMVVVFGPLDKQTNEIGPGGRASDAGAKVCVFGAGGMLGRYVCYNLGECAQTIRTALQLILHHFLTLHSSMMIPQEQTVT